MKIALGYDISEEEPAASSSSPSSSSASTEGAKPLQQVEAEVMDPNDPWGKK